MRAATSQGVAIARSGSGNGALERLGTGNEMRVRDWRSPGAASAREACVPYLCPEVERRSGEEGAKGIGLVGRIEGEKKEEGSIDR